MTAAISMTPAGIPRASDGCAPPYRDWINTRMVGIMRVRFGAPPGCRSFSCAYDVCHHAR